MKKKFYHKQIKTTKPTYITRLTHKVLTNSNIDIRIPVPNYCPVPRISTNTILPFTVFTKNNFMIAVHKNYNYGISTYIHEYIPRYKVIPPKSLMERRQIINAHYDIPDQTINVFIGSTLIPELSVPYYKDIPQEVLFQFSTIYNIEHILQCINTVKHLIPVHKQNNITIKSILGAMINIQ